MANNVYIKDGGGKSVRACVHSSEDQVGGIVAYTREYDKTIPRRKAFLNNEYGNSLNQDATAGGTPVGIHDGLDSILWTGSEVVGSSVTFNSTNRAFAGTQSIRVDGASLNDVWQVAKGSDQDLSSYETLNMHVNVNRRWTTGDSIAVYGWDTGTGAQVGVSVLLENYMNEFSFDDWQTVNIPLSDMGLENQTIDSFRFEQVGVDGQSPDYFIDALQLLETGSLIRFTVTPDAGKDLYIDAIRLTIVNNVTGAAARNYNELLGETLANGISIIRTSRQEVIVGRNISDVAEFYAAGFNQVVLEEGATESTLVLEIKFLPYVLLESLYGDDISFGIQDDLSGFTRMTAVARGRTNA